MVKKIQSKIVGFKVKASGEVMKMPATPTATIVVWKHRPEMSPRVVATPARMP